jgi:hypothetical protein
MACRSHPLSSQVPILLRWQWSLPVTSAAVSFFPQRGASKLSTLPSKKKFFFLCLVGGSGFPCMAVPQRT